MGQLKLSGSLLVGPTTVSDTAFPAGVTELPVSTASSPKSSLVDSGAQVRNLQSPSAFVALSGVGASDSVTQGDFIYAKVTGSMQLRLTFAQPGGPDLVIVKPHGGLYVDEFPSDQYLKLLEAKGSGVIEYLVSGQR